MNAKDIAIIFIMCGIISLLSGCGSTRGWRVSFGVAPVSQIDDKQGLKEHGGDYGQASNYRK